ncbi:MAG: asparagine synthase (glutamine-hydrolyzing) [Candidatus Nanopelagicales bacterium]
MCGLTALFSPSGAAELGAVVAMTDLIAHRGPDSEGFVVIGTDAARPFAGPDTDPASLRADVPFAPRAAAASDPAARGQAVLGHRRLSILDLSPTGHQPMSDAAGDIWLVFNGEIYNFVELRAQLIGLGHRFFGNSDTEVLLAAYREWGVEALPRLRGMFGFVLVDLRTGSALLARDRFGIKPLYYSRTADGGLAVASEIKSLVIGQPPVVNGRRLYDFLNFAIHDHTTETMFAGVEQVPAGGYLHLLLADPAVFTPQRWWQLRAGEFRGDLTEAGRQYAGLLRVAVDEHLRSDVPVGSCLSGGLDSSTIVSLMAEELAARGGGEPLRTFTATSIDAKLDESGWAQLVVERTGAEAFQVEPDMAGLPDLLPQLVWHQDEPFGSTSILAQWEVFGLAQRSRTTVLLDGQGADEQLAGYTYYFGYRLAELASRGQLGQLRRELAALTRLHPEALRRALMLTGYLSVPPGVGRRAGRLIGAPGQDPDSWLSREALGVAGFPDPLEEVGARTRSVRDLALAQLTASNLPMLLRYEDRDSMAHSIEARVPFLDHRVVEFAVSLPSEQLISDGMTKRVLREAVRDVVPEPIRTRVDKIGFATAEERWMRANAAVVRGMLSEAIDLLGGVVTPDALQRYDAVIAGRAGFDYWIWRIISAGAWVQRFGVRI